MNEKFVYQVGNNKKVETYNNSSVVYFYFWK